MKQITLVFMALVLSTTPLLSFADSHATAAKGKADVTLQEFMNLPLEQRIDLCVSMVDASDIGECATVKKPKNNAVAHIPEAHFKLAVERCSRDLHSSNIQQLSACARERLNAGGSDNWPLVTEHQIKKAEEYCGKHYFTNQDFGSCVAGILRNIDYDQN